MSTLSHKSIKIIRSVIRYPVVTFVLFSLGSIIAYQYFQTKIYNFPQLTFFLGDSLYNPYAGASRTWLKANFHAHSESWFGVTNGKQSGEEVVNAYLNAGYSIASLSDYHRINQHIYNEKNIAIPSYEHGMNLSKQHHLCIDANEVIYNDVMLWQNDHIKQYLLQKMAGNSSLLCINHPGLRKGHSKEAIGLLTGYHLLEGLNGPRKYLGYWDAVLSTGRPVWLLGNDDCHDLFKEDFAKSWTLVQGDKKDNQSILQSLREGRSYAVQRTKEFSDQDSLNKWAFRNHGDILDKVSCNKNMVTLTLNEPAKEIRLIGQSGTILKTERNIDSILYTFREGDTYVRAEIETESFTAYLNPVIRFDGKAIPQNTMLAQTNFIATLSLRMGILILYALWLYLLLPTQIKIVRGGTHKKYPTYGQA